MLIARIFVFLLIVNSANANVFCTDAFHSESHKEFIKNMGDKFLSLQDYARQVSDSTSSTVDSSKNIYLRSLELAKAYNASSFDVLPHFVMAKHYFYRQFVSGTSGRLYLSKEEFSSKVVSFKRGKAYNSKGKKIDTQDGVYIYIISNGQLFVSKERNADGKVKHATLGIGLPVSAAGEIVFEKGRLVKINANSGRYRTPKILVYDNLKMLEEKGLEVPSHLFEKYSKPEIRIFSDTLTNLAMAGVRLNENQIVKHQLDFVSYVKKLEAWSKQPIKSKSQIWEIFDEILLEGKSSDKIELLKQEVIFKSIVASRELGFRSEYMYELKYLLPFLQFDTFVSRFNELESKAYFSKSTAIKLKKLLEELKYISSVQEW